MKKLVSIIFLFLLAANVCYADKNWFDLEVAKIRDVKNAQTTAINNELTQIENGLLRIQADTRLSEEQKAKLSNDYNMRKSELTAEKNRIEEKYKADKAELKRRWKNGETSSKYSTTYTTPVKTQTTTGTYTTPTYTKTTTYTKYEVPSKVETVKYSQPQYTKTTQTYTVEQQGKIKSTDLRPDLQTVYPQNFQVKLNKHK